jgi:hypothetical protein
VLKRRSWIAFLISVALLMAGCRGAGIDASPTPSANPGTPAENKGIPTTSGDVPRITPQELKALLDTGARVLVIDTRDRASYEQGHIPGAGHMLSSEIETRYREIPPDARIVLYCA